MQNEQKKNFIAAKCKINEYIYVSLRCEILRALSKCIYPRNDIKAINTQCKTVT